MAFVADVVAGALQALGVEKCCLVGHSMGGYVALEFLRRHEAMLAGLVLMNSTPNPDSEAKREARAREVEAVLAGKKGLFAEEAVRGRFAPQNRRRFAGRIEELTALAELCDDEGIAALLRGMASREDTNAVMTRSAVPQLFILGADDDYINPGVVDKLREGHPAARFVVLENVGHMAMVEAPEAAAAALLEFAK